jgi:hypothetical protein
VRRLKSSREETPKEAAAAASGATTNNDLLFSCLANSTIKVWRQSSTGMSNDPLSVLSKGTLVVNVQVAYMVDWGGP